MASKIGRIDLPFAGGFYAARSRQFSSQRCINWYPNFAQSDALNEYCLYPTPGVSQLFGAAVVDGPARGAHVMNGVPYFLCGNILYRIDRITDAVGNETLERAAVAQISGSARVRMASNRNQLCIVVPGESAWIYVEGATSAEQIIDPDFDGPADDVVQLDSVFVFCKTGTNRIFHSDLNDGTKYEPLDFTMVNQLTVVRGLMVYRNQLYVMGDNATVPYANVGGTEFLFQVIPSAVIDSGLSAVNAKTNSRGAFVYLGGGQNEELAVWYCQGGSPVKISTDAIDYFLQNFSPDDIARAYMIQHSQSGSDFVALTIGRSTIVYDFTASQAAGRSVWHERSSRITNPTGYTDRQWRVASLIQAYNRTLVGDIIDSRIGQIDDDYFTEYGTLVSRTLITQPFINLGARSRVSSIELYMGQNPTADTLHDDTQEAETSFFLTSEKYPDYEIFTSMTYPYHLRDDIDVGQMSFLGQGIAPGDIAELQAGQIEVSEISLTDWITYVTYQCDPENIQVGQIEVTEVSLTDFITYVTQRCDPESLQADQIEVTEISLDQVAWYLRYENGDPESVRVDQIEVTSVSLTT